MRACSSHNTRSSQNLRDGWPCLGILLVVRVSGSVKNFKVSVAKHLNYKKIVTSLYFVPPAQRRVCVYYCPYLGIIYIFMWALLRCILGSSLQCCSKLTSLSLAITRTLGTELPLRFLCYVYRKENRQMSFT